MSILGDDPNDALGKKIADLVELLLEGEIQSAWEEDFIYSMVDRFEKGYNFTVAQVEKIDELHGRHY